MTIYGNIRDTDSVVSVHKVSVNKHYNDFFRVGLTGGLSNKNFYNNFSIKNLNEINNILLS